MLVDGGWKLVEVEPEVIAVNGNGNGHDDAIGPMVELVPSNGHAPNGNGHTPAPDNGNGHHDKAGEPQRSLFSWPEFMAEKPVKPKGRKAQALSLFEWVVEREREAEPVGAGRWGLCVCCWTALFPHRRLLQACPPAFRRRACRRRSRRPSRLLPVQPRVRHCLFFLRLFPGCACGRSSSGGYLRRLFPDLAKGLGFSCTGCASRRGLR